MDMTLHWSPLYINRSRPSTQRTYPVWVTGEEMKVVLASVFVLLAAATALALGKGTVATNLSAAAVQVVDRTGEPAALLFSGSLLIGLAGAVKRFTV